jgi:hypothetical protein
VSRLSRFACAIVCATVAPAVLPAVSLGARPASGAMVEDHRHYTQGHDWHVQLEVSRSRTRLATVVTYSQECDGTGFTQGAKISLSGAFDVTGRFPSGGGTWNVKGRFTSPATAVGTWSVERGDCAVQGEFNANDRTGHFLLGNPYEYPPERIKANRKLMQLSAQFRKNAWRFTPARARALGYSFRNHPRCPSLVHARKYATRMWGTVLDPLAPQSLMYWCPSPGHFILAGAMFRAPAATRPPTFGRLIQWHRHATTPTANWMTHMWLVPRLQDAWATCSPFRAFDEAGMFKYQPFTPIAETKPCSDTDFSR